MPNPTHIQVVIGIILYAAEECKNFASTPRDEFTYTDLGVTTALSPLISAATAETAYPNKIIPIIVTKNNYSIFCSPLKKFF